MGRRFERRSYRMDATARTVQRRITMEFKEFIAERKRMCKAHAPDGFICKCAELKCPLHELAQRSPEKSCYAGCTRYPKEAEKIVE